MSKLVGASYADSLLDRRILESVLANELRAQDPATWLGSRSKEDPPVVTSIDAIAGAFMIQNKEGIPTVGWADLEGSPVVSPSTLEVEDDEMAFTGGPRLALEGVTAELLHGSVVYATGCRRLGSAPGR
jgi:hypothetical protein